MSPEQSRRGFLATASGAILGLTPLTGRPPVRTKERPREWRVTYDSAVEPLVRLIEESERDRCVEVVGERLKHGVSYRELMSAVFLAGLRNGGDMGYYHCIYVIHAANQLASRTPVKEQCLPLFGAMDLFKSWQAKRRTEPGHFGMRGLPKRLRSADNALRYFEAAARRSDPDGVEAAVIALGDSLGRHRVFEILATQALLAGGVHHPILVCNCWRVLEAMGWSHYRPTLRAMSRMLASYQEIRETWFLPKLARARAEHGARPAGWARPAGNESFTRDLLNGLRTGDSDRVVRTALDALFAGRVRAGAIWDAVHLAAAESLVRYGDGNALHENTRLNSVHYTFRTLSGDDDRLMALLLAVKYAADTYRSRKGKSATSILELSWKDLPVSPDEAADDILTSTVQEGAVERALALTREARGRQAVARALERIVVRKARNDAHPYKIAAANHENCRWVSSRWRPYLAAAPVGLQRGGDDDVTDNPDAQIILRAREVLGKL